MKVMIEMIEIIEMIEMIEVIIQKIDSIKSIVMVVTNTIIGMMIEMIEVNHYIVSAFVLTYQITSCSVHKQILEIPSFHPSLDIFVFFC